MTFDLNEEKRLMLERFQKGTGFVYDEYDDDENLIDGVSAAKIRDINDKYDDMETLSNMGPYGFDDGTFASLERQRENALVDVEDQADRLIKDGRLSAPWTSPEAADARLRNYYGPGELGKSWFLDALLEDAMRANNFDVGAAKQIRDRFDKEIAEGKGPIYDEYMKYMERWNDATARKLPLERMGESRTKQEQADRLLAKKAKRTEQVNKSLDINAAMASRDQSFTPEPIQRADTEAFQRMGLFGKRRKRNIPERPAEPRLEDVLALVLQSGAPDATEVADRMRAMRSKGYSDRDVLGEFDGRLKNIWDPERVNRKPEGWRSWTPRDIAEELYEPGMGGLFTHHRGPSDEELMEENEESARYAQQNYGQPAEARLDQPDARDSSS